MFRFETMLALRHLRSGGGQTALTISAVGTGVLVIVFISALVFGVRAHVSEVLTDILPHVIVKLPEMEPSPLTAIPGVKPGLKVSRIERQTQQRKEIKNWQKAQVLIQGLPEVRVVAPAVTGQGFLSRGGQQVGAQVYGADPERLNVVTPLTKYLVDGHYLGLGTEEIFLSYKTAQDLKAKVGDRVRLTSSEGVASSFLVAGTYDTGQEGMTACYITLRSAQSLFAMQTAVRTILVKADDMYHADRVADRIMALMPYEAKSWSRQYPQFVSLLDVYNAVAYLVSGFSLAASSFAIASVLIVSVLQKSKQIGILKSVGAKSRQIMMVFLLEGLGIALIGSSIGAALGSLVVWILGLFKQPPRRPGAVPEDLFPSVLTWQLLVIAMLAAIIATMVAAVLPARRAARLNPVEVLR